MKLHTVIVSYERLPLLQETIASYLTTVTLPYSLLIVDNGSSAPVHEWLQDGVPGATVLLLGKNLYPGAATNIGFAAAPADATHLHRSDNDMFYLPEWCDEVERAFAEQPRLGQLGLRTNDEELWCTSNVGGTAIIDKRLWNEGLRYDERPWSMLGSVTEDYYLSRDVERRDWRWARVERPCVVHKASGDRADPYYQHSYGVRGI